MATATGSVNNGDEGTPLIQIGDTSQNEDNARTAEITRIVEAVLQQQQPVLQQQQSDNFPPVTRHHPPSCCAQTVQGVALLVFLAVIGLGGYLLGKGDIVCHFHSKSDL